jgi:hypothetical protein
MTVMSSHYNLILIEMMENIFLQMQIEVLETFIRFTGNLFIVCSNSLNEYKLTSYNKEVQSVLRNEEFPTR